MPSPVVSLKYSRSGALLTKTPPSHGMMPFGDERLPAKSVRLSKRPSPLRVFQQGDDALGSGLSGPFQRARIAAILDDVHPPAFVERDRHRVPDQRLRGCQLDPVARLELEAGQRLVRRQADLAGGHVPRRSSRRTP